jgi:acyl-CoA thioester hydrolase
MKNIKHKIPIQIRFADIDRLNHVNNACYLNFFELGRVHYFTKILGETINWNESGFVLARTEINHIEPVFLTDDIYCFSKVTKIGTKSLTLNNVICKQKNEDELIECANGLGVLVAMDYKLQKSIEIPKIWKERIEKFEGDLYLNADY